MIIFTRDTDQICWTADDMLTEEQNEMVESAAEMLYGLIHVRYILTSKGMNAMVCSCIFMLDRKWVMPYAVLCKEIGSEFSRQPRYASMRGF